MYTHDWFRNYIDQWGNEEPSQFSAAFARTIPISPGETRLIGIGSGSGIIEIFSLIERHAKSATFTDIEPTWLEIAKRNVSIKIRGGLISPSQVRFLPPTGFAELPYAEIAQHDLVAFNPPQLPYAYVDRATKQKIDSDPIEHRFRWGGELGLDVVEQFFAWYAGLHAPKPDAVILLSSFLGRRHIDEAISAAGLRPCEDPVETDATLRPMLWKQADAFSRSPTELEDRSICKVGDTWHKKLLTFRLRNKEG